MKKVTLAVLILLAVVDVAGAQSSVTIFWDASLTSTTVGYNVYRTKTGDGCDDTPVNCTKLNLAPIPATGTCLPASPPTRLRCFTDSALGASGRWFYVVRAVDADGIESINAPVASSPPQPDSTADHLAVILPPSPPTNTRRAP